MPGRPDLPTWQSSIVFHSLRGGWQSAGPGPIHPPLPRAMPFKFTPKNHAGESGHPLMLLLGPHWQNKLLATLEY